MAGLRRLLVALAVAAGLVGLTAAAAPGGPADTVFAASLGPDTVLRPHNGQPAVAPAKRPLGEQLSVVVVAVLVALTGAAAVARGWFSPSGTAPPPVGARRLRFRLRGPPLQAI